MKKPKFIVAIPTYNRLDILKENLEVMLPVLEENNIQLFISDDSTDNKTEVFIKELTEKFNNINYKRNTPSLGHDENCMSIFDSVCEYSYVWYLGDSYCIDLNELIKIKEIILNNEIDFVFVSNGNVEFSSCGFIDDLSDFILNNVWYLTLSGATIYGPRVVDYIKTIKERRKYKNFQQLGYILDYVFNKKSVEVSVFVNSKQAIRVNEKKSGSYWKKNLISVFCFDWVNLIEFFDKGILNIKELEIIKSHNNNTKVLSIMNIISSRSVGGISFFDVINYRKYIWKAASSKSTLVYMMLVSLIPKYVLSFFIKLYKIKRS